MVEPTAHQALLSLADELEAIATGSVPHSPASGAYTHAARLARDHAAVLAETPGGPGTPLGEGETSQELTDDLRASALDAVLGMLDLDTWERWLEGRGEVRDLVSKMLAAGEPFIRAEEREQIARLAEECKAEYPLCERPGLIIAHPPFADLIRGKPRTADWKTPETGYRPWHLESCTARDALVSSGLCDCGGNLDAPVWRPGDGPDSTWEQS